jgi:hypothetical protein
MNHLVEMWSLPFRDRNQVRDFAVPALAVSELNLKRQPG